MKKYIYAGLIALAMLSLIAWQSNRIREISKERNVYIQNTKVLLEDVKFYQTKDSLNVASVGELQLKVSEFEKYRSSDMQLISSLQVDNKRLQKITTAQTQTLYELAGTVRDSFIIRDNFIHDTLRCITILDKWFSMNGCIYKSSIFTGKFENNDSLLYVEHVIPKRFLGFLWKYGMKERRQEIVSRNPHTKITSAEFITIRK